MKPAKPVANLTQETPDKKSGGHNTASPEAIHSKKIKKNTKKSQKTPPNQAFQSKKTRIFTKKSKNSGKFNGPKHLPADFPTFFFCSKNIGKYLTNTKLVV